MPVDFRCPSCGAQTVVADQYAGQTGPCANCGATVTIPLLPGGVGPPPQPAKSTSLVAILAIGAGVLFVCGGILLALVLPAVQAARQRAQRMECPNNLKQIGLAMHNYHTVNNSFPPVFTVDAPGKPLHSWRTLILPYIDRGSLYGSIRLDEPWDSPANSSITSTPIREYWCPSGPKSASAQTSYVVVTGPNTIFNGVEACSIADITDGTSNTILAVEIQGSGIRWSEPKDLTEEEFIEGFTSGTLKSPHPGGIYVLLADGSVRFLNRSIDVKTLRNLVEKADGNPIPNDF